MSPADELALFEAAAELVLKIYAAIKAAKAGQVTSDSVLASFKLTHDAIDTNNQTVDAELAAGLSKKFDTTG